MKYTAKYPTLYRQFMQFLATARNCGISI